MAGPWTHVLGLAVLMVAVAVAGVLHADNSEQPKFRGLINNVTAPVGRDATFMCIVDDLAPYKVAWVRVDTQTILTVASHVITKNHRIAVWHQNQRTWHLQVRDVRETDRGWYMCQVNTDPMKSQVGYLEVVVPPDILDYPTSTDMVVREGSNVTLNCAATGSPTPTITWRREGGEGIPLGNGQEVASVEGSYFNITRVNRLHMGAYLCIASNGVPPTVSKRIMLIVHFPPMIWIQNQLVGAYEGQTIILECNSEAFPKSINYWSRESGDIIAQGGRFEPLFSDNAYKVQMKLTIRAVTSSDFGTFKCVSKNSLGDTDGSIILYQIPVPSTAFRVEATTAESTLSKDIDVFTGRVEEEGESVSNDLSTNEAGPSDAERVTGERSSADLKVRERQSYDSSRGSPSRAHSLTHAILIVFSSLYYCHIVGVSM